MTEKELYERISAIMTAESSRYEKECDTWWNNLSLDDKMKAFYSVCRRIYKGDVEDRRSYRGVIYDVFNLGSDAYVIGMDCGYMDLHNLIWAGIEADKKEKDTNGN
jgi:hypothetical protein